MSRNTLLITIALILVVVAGWWLYSNQYQKPSYQSPAVVTPSGTVPRKQPSSPSAQTAENVVTISSSGFSPKEIKIKAGGTVSWVNKDSVNHIVNSVVHPTHQVYPPLNNVGLLKPGEKKSLQFPTAGTYKYHDHLNPSLTGTVIVE